jgi:N-acetylneuraminic acid mutarotase
MRKLPVLLVPVLLSALGAVLLSASDQPKIPPMPAAVAGNVVVTLRGGIDIYSLMGIGPKKTWDDITSKVYVLNLKSAKWTESRPVPGVAGRLGASAIVVRGKIFVFGGYVVDGQGAELTANDVNAFFPLDRRWYRGEDLPVPVDSAVIGAEHDRYIYIVGGRSKDGPVNNVQVYDAQQNTWSQATPFPGNPVFGHAGGLTDGTIVFVDGAKKNPSGGSAYVSSDECWMGKIERKDPNKITWTKIPPHPGVGRFGIVAGVVESHKILFSGGTTVPHNFKGLDADGKPAQFADATFAYDEHSNQWETIDQDTEDLRTDTRGIVMTPIGALIVGGMLRDQSVTGRVLLVNKK